MAIDFSKASLLGYNHETQFFGDTSMRYRVLKNLEIEGFLTDLTNLSGVSGILKQEEAFAHSTTDWQAIILQGINYGSGVIENWSFEEGDDVKKKKYKVTIRIPESGNINNLPSSGYYSNIDYTNFQYIETLEDNITWSNDVDRKTYNHSVRVKVLTNDVTGSIAKGKAIASNLFATVGNLVGLGGDYSQLASYQPKYTEAYDQLNAECSFTKEVEFLSTVNNNYSVNKTYSYNRGADGTSVVTESAEIKAHNQDYTTVLANALQIETGSAYTNCLDVFNAYKSTNEYTFPNQAISKATSLDKFNKTLTYQISYTNNPTITSSGFYLEYDQTISYQGQGLITTSEQGKYIGFGYQGNAKYNLAVNGYNNTSGSIYGRTLAAYNKFKSIFSLADTSKFILTQKNESYNPYQGFVEYTHSYTNDTTYINDTNIVQAEVVIGKQYRRLINEDITVFQYKEINQQSFSYDVSSHNATISLRGKRNTPIDTYLTYAKGLVPNDIKGDSLSSVRYSLSPNENKFVLDIEWYQLYEK